MLSRCWRKVLRDRDRAVSLNQPCPRRVNHRFNLFGVCSSFLSIYLSVCLYLIFRCTLFMVAVGSQTAAPANNSLANIFSLRTSAAP